jgi:hypothetical protein
MRTNEPIKKRALLTELAMLVLVVGAITGAIVHAELKPMSKDDLKIAASDLRSLAASSKQLTEQDVAGQLTRRFFDSQSQLIKKKVHSSRTSLDSADAEKGLELEHWNIRHLASQLDSTLDRLNDPTANHSVEITPLDDLKTKLKQEEDTLKADPE